MPGMTATCHTRPHDAYCDVVAREIEAFAGAIEGADPGAPVVTCPPWTIADLAEHLGGVHRWAEHMVRNVSPERVPGSSLNLGVPDDKTELASWVRGASGVLESTFRKADPDASMWAWGSDKHARFWPRRMVHETVVHRADAELSLGRPAAVDATIAIDGVDEFLDNLPHAAYFAPRVTELLGDGGTLAFRADDTSWHIRLRPDRFEWDHAEDTADVTVYAGPATLYLLMYGRVKPADATNVEGDRALLNWWLERASI